MFDIFLCMDFTPAVDWLACRMIDVIGYFATGTNSISCDAKSELRMHLLETALWISLVQLTLPAQLPIHLLPSLVQDDKTLCLMFVDYVIPTLSYYASHFTRRGCHSVKLWICQVYYYTYSTDYCTPDLQYVSCNVTDKVLLKSVEVLTLRDGQMTTGRRSKPVPQLMFKGGSASSYSAPLDTVQCYNRGHDGYDVQV